MADLYPVAGARLYIGDAPIALPSADITASYFNSVSWTEIDGWSQMGTVGDAAEVITTRIINRGRDVKQKGTANAGSMQNIFAIIRDDPGQIAIRAAASPSNKSNYPFRILWNDPVGSPATASKTMFVGIVTSAQEQGGEANTMQMLSANIEVNSNIVDVAAG